ncbi:MAG TPA: lysophospholipid acyltransferase family protein [Gemmatimonadales bacterium]|nr:lysophospholipid acyltransferase family protein [Gemmatimonadales bacterium]
MHRLWITIASLWAWLVLAVVIAVWLPLMALTRLVTAPFDRGRYTVGLLFRKIAVVQAALNPLWRFRRSGVPISNPRRPYVVVSNHESFVDILLISHLPWEMKWLSKAELFRIPVMGWEMAIAGDIPVHRGRPSSAAEAMARCRDILKDRVSVMIFPEGTRSAGGDLLPFKDGAFRLAIKAGVPVLPLAISGTATALRKNSWRMGRSNAEVRVLPPVETTGLTLRDAPALRDQVRELIGAAREEMRGGAGNGKGETRK